MFEGKKIEIEFFNIFHLPSINQIHNILITNKMHFSVYVYFVHSILTNMFRPLLRPYSGWRYYYKNKKVQMWLLVSHSLHTAVYTSPTQCIKTHHFTTSGITPYRLNNFNSQDFNRYPFWPVFILRYLQTFYWTFQLLWSDGDKTNQICTSVFL